MGVPEEDFDSLNDAVSPEFFELITQTAANNTKIYTEVFKAEPHNEQTDFEKLTADREAFAAMSIEERTQAYEERIGDVVGHIVDYPVYYMSAQSLGKTQIFPLLIF